MPYLIREGQLVEDESFIFPQHLVEGEFYKTTKQRWYTRQNGDLVRLPIEELPSNVRMLALILK